MFKKKIWVCQKPPLCGGKNKPYPCLAVALAKAGCWGLSRTCPPLMAGGSKYTRGGIPGRAESFWSPTFLVLFCHSGKPADSVGAPRIWKPLIGSGQARVTGWKIRLLCRDPYLQFGYSPALKPGDSLVYQRPS